MNKQNHINIPIFIQHIGCPNMCVFCDQNSITSAPAFDIKNVREDIDRIIATSQDSYKEISYFGGSFTGIDRNLMIELLDLAQEYVNKGLVDGIRFSTRPDYISKEIIEILNKYTINEIELGVQSINDNVLSLCKRGHKSIDTKNACELLKESNINFGCQMMIGLPGSTIENEIETAQYIISTGARSTRIYPCIVFKNTELEYMTRNGTYIPLTLEDAVNRSSKVFKMFLDNNVNVLRIGLQDNNNLHSENTYFCGPNNPSFGELVNSKIYFDLINEKTSKFNLENKNIVIECAKGHISSVSGYQKHNKLYLMEKRHTKSVKILENMDVERYNINIIID